MDERDSSSGGGVESRVLELANTPLHELLDVEPVRGGDEEEAATRVEDDEAPVDRGTQLHSIAVNRVAGASIHQLAATFGYSYVGMAGLLRSEEMQKRVSDLNDDLLTRAAAGVAKIVLHLDKMLDLELKLALPEEGSPITFDSAKSVKSRHYLIDKVVAQKQVVTNINRGEGDPEAQAVLSQSRDLLNKLLEAGSKRITDIHSSPHVHEGIDAVPRAIDLDQFNTNSEP